ncbi:Methylthioribose-1-phosphate isomerase 2 [Galdieria sulphuraria]|uniref:Methylthioribose-1-phosphate isomerase n=1 Tax=Galdieria sulphuraria TaxID=130081 RepID=M2WVR2_GALSU|nr:eukaryotic translation initiation factor eIF-2B alpha subunit [Galdieria sulphuraria]EME28075.1 eukaryotic translation initiation factor eIF-2B alpha subunit [Galdieria sulphuraria]GJD12111.1 Methylthioribose-1-phosphate isomerase 2 [Galdieria sulphuraria]|eukprot:XP_005704595.1 eukaryotic translation initiation factor eIF-2B alpha subunit [Galdieria sulphuraria]
MVTNPYCSVQLAEDHKSVVLLDQRRLPNLKEYRNFYSASEVAEAIREMVVRGAPAIGVAAGFGIAVEAHRLLNLRDFEGYRKELEMACDLLERSRPTAVNLSWVVQRIRKLLSQEYNSQESLERAIMKEASLISSEDVAVNYSIAKIGNQLIPHRANILHLCNTGALATVDWGTALGVIRMGHIAGKEIHVWVCETRPRLQGAKLTTWELQQQNIPMTLIVDSAAGYLMQMKKVDLCLVGADRVASNGDTANKIGTYTMACLARLHHIPFYIVTPLSSIDANIISGDEIQIEERLSDEILRPSGESLVASETTSVYNPAFDITPACFISGFVTEVGILQPPFTLQVLARLKKEYASRTIT